MCFSFFLHDNDGFSVFGKAQNCWRDIVLRYIADNEVWGVATFLPTFIFAPKFTHFPLSFWAAMRSQASLRRLCVFIYIYGFRRFRNICCLERSKKFAFERSLSIHWSTYTHIYTYLYVYVLVLLVFVLNIAAL